MHKRIARNDFFELHAAVGRTLRRAKRYNLIKKWNTLMFLERELKGLLKVVRKEIRPLRPQVDALVEGLHARR